MQMRYFNSHSHIYAGARSRAPVLSKSDAESLSSTYLKWNRSGTQATFQHICVHIHKNPHTFIAFIRETKQLYVRTLFAPHFTIGFSL